MVNHMSLQYVVFASIPKNDSKIVFLSGSKVVGSRINFPMTYYITSKSAFRTIKIEPRLKKYMKKRTP